MIGPYPVFAPAKCTVRGMTSVRPIEPLPATKTWNWSTKWKCAPAFAPGSCSTMKACGGCVLPGAGGWYSSALANIGSADEDALGEGGGPKKSVRHTSAALATCREKRVCATSRESAAYIMEPSQFR